MLRWFIYICAILLAVDHVYTHWGPAIINSVASSIVGREVEIVKNPPHKESIIDRGINAVVGTLNKLTGGERKE